MTARAAPRASAAVAISTSSITAATSCRRRRGQSLRGRRFERDTKLLAGLVDTALGRYRNARRVGPHREKLWAAVILGERQQDVRGGGVGHLGDLAPQHDVAALARGDQSVFALQEADGGDRGAIGDPAQQPGRGIGSADPRQRPRRRRPRSTTTAPDAGRRLALRPRRRPRPSSCRRRRAPPVPADRSCRDRQGHATPRHRCRSGRRAVRAHDPKSTPFRPESAGWCRAARPARR